MGKLKKKKRYFTFQKGIQALSLTLFVFLLWQTAFPLVESFVPVDIFLRLDPLVVLLVPMAAKQWIPSLLVGMCVLLLTAVVGRLFCGYVCPMGITLDMFRGVGKALFGKGRPFSLASSFLHAKYIFLTILAFAAFFGVNHIFWGSPISLITRFYTFFIHPLVLLVGNVSLPAIRTHMDFSGVLAYVHVEARVFHTVYFIAIFFTFLFFLERVRPRFWCRYLCPAGAIFALVSWKPLWRRRVHVCTQCGACVRSCPMGAISPEVSYSDTERCVEKAVPARKKTFNAYITRHTDCIACQACVRTCPEQGIRFAFSVKKHTVAKSLYGMPTLPSRRHFLGAAMAGSGLAGLAYVNAASFVPAVARATSAQSGCIRPPGARPELDFLSLCVRCGQCMKACPTNGLQPSVFVAGLEGVFSPVLMARVGPCEPECTVCGNVCPTGALVPLPIEDKRQAKIGTAVVYPELCLAWAEGRSCVVCQEVCAYGAVKIEKHEGSPVPVPVIYARRCFGCGFCERHCPVHIPAIVVQPLNALRLNENSYAKAAKSAGLDLVPVSLRPQQQYDVVVPDVMPEGQLPPGFTE